MLHGLWMSSPDSPGCYLPVENHFLTLQASLIIGTSRALTQGCLKDEICSWPRKGGQICLLGDWLEDAFPLFWGGGLL